MPPRPLNATAASLLGFLHEGPMTGWDLVEVAQMLIGDFWSLTRSQVYRELAAMAETGLVEAGARGRRDRRPYTITAEGRVAFADWVAREPGPESIRFPLLLTIAFGRHIAPERLRDFVARHKAVHEERLAGYLETYAALNPPGDDGDPYARATLEFGVAYERAVLAWFKDLSPQAGGGAGIR